MRGAARGSRLGSRALRPLRLEDGEAWVVSRKHSRIHILPRRQACANPSGGGRRRGMRETWARGDASPRVQPPWPIIVPSPSLGVECLAAVAAEPLCEWCSCVVDIVRHALLVRSPVA